MILNRVQCNRRFDKFMLSHKFRRCDYDTCVYFYGENVEDMIYLLIYVDDMLIASKQAYERNHSCEESLEVRV